MTAIDAAKFPKRLVLARKTAGYSQADAAQRLRMTRQMWSLYEKGTVPTIELCERMAAILNVSPGWLAGWEERI